MPDFEVEGMRLFKRLTMVLDDGKITKVFYPVPEPAQDADNVLKWCRDNPQA